MVPVASANIVNGVVTTCYGILCVLSTHNLLTFTFGCFSKFVKQLDKSVNMAPSKQIVGTLVVILFLVYESSAIHCFYCNSANNSACNDIKALDEDMRTRLIPTVHCETAIPSPVAINFFCRKITQTIFHSHRDSEVRVTRGCGWVRHHKECYRADNSDHLETVCQCFQDHCNAADHPDPATTTALFLLLITVLYFVR